MDETNQTGAPSPDEVKKVLKKQAKREAKAMQALEQAQRDVKKAEQKLARATQNLQKRQARLDACEEKLEKIRLIPLSLPREAPSPEISHASEIEVVNRPETLAESEQNAVMLNEVIQELIEEGALREASHLAQADENATQDLFETSTEELLNLGGFPLADENATRDLELVELEEPAVEEDLAVDLAPPVEEIAGNAASPSPEASQDEAAQSGASSTPARAKKPARSTKSPTRTTGTRRPGTSASSPPETTTRRRSPSSRAKSNGTQRAGEEENS